MDSIAVISGFAVDTVALSGVGGWIRASGPDRSADGRRTLPLGRRPARPTQPLPDKLTRFLFAGSRLVAGLKAIH